MPLSVYKLGGSLFDLPDLASRLHNVLDSGNRSETSLIVVGGGSAADLVRDWDRRFSLGESVSHRLALDSLELTRMFLERLIGPMMTVTDFEQIEQLDTNQAALIAVRELLQTAEASELPQNWDFTSDSISAWIATVTRAYRLVLLKSVPAPACGTREGLVSGDLVDREFSRWMKSLPRIDWVNLREGTPPVTLKESPNPSIAG